IPEPVPAGIRKWVEDNRASIETSTDPDLADIKDAITNNSYYTTCIPDFGDTCEEPTLVSSKIIVTAVNNQVDKEVGQPQSEYIQVLPPNTCERLVDPLEHDTAIESALPPGATVYKKITPLN